MATAEKEQTVSEISDLIARSKSIYLTDFQGMNVDLATKMRRKLRDANVEYRVAKNTLTKRALKAHGVEGLDKFLEGPTGIAFGADEVGAAKVLADFSKEFEKPAIRAGFVDGAPVNVAHIQRLGAIPSRETLLAMVAGTLNNIVASFAGCLEALREQRSAAS